MKKLVIAAAAAALLVGCGVNEAEKFGYRGADLDEGDMMFFSTGPTVTNWVPARVLSVCEEYPVSAEESALVKAAGVIEPSSSFEKVPEGYSKLHDEPWFVTWQKDNECFGRKGVNGFISHFDEDKNVWTTSETYFSSYYDDQASALAALADLRKQMSGPKFAPKKFYDFDNCWVAEYLRLRVMCLVGQKADGKWSCMLDINDKFKAGCGQWEPVPAQESRRAEFKYRKDITAWKALRDKSIAENHKAVEKIRAERGVALFGDEVKPVASGDGRQVYQRFGSLPAEEAGEREPFWSGKLEALAKAAGVKFEGTVEKQSAPSGHEVWCLATSNDIFDVRLDMAFPPPQSASDAKTPDGESDEPMPQIVEWRELVIEKTLPGFSVPPRPQPPKR